MHSISQCCLPAPAGSSSSPRASPRCCGRGPASLAVFCLAAAVEAAFLSAQNGAGFIWTKKTRITFLLFQLCSSRLCGSIARVNTRNGANARALESFLVVPSVLPTSPTCRVEYTLPDSFCYDFRNNLRSRGAASTLPVVVRLKQLGRRLQSLGRL